MYIRLLVGCQPQARVATARVATARVATARVVTGCVSSMSVTMPSSRAKAEMTSCTCNTEGRSLQQLSCPTRSVW